MNLKTAIVDDEKHACETLLWQIKQLDFDLDILGLYQNPVAAVQALKKNPPDLLLLDIEMPGLNGFQFLEELDMRGIHVVFTTAYDQFALNAFRVNAVDYLIKPVEINELRDAIDRVIKRKSPYDRNVIGKIFSELDKARAAKLKIALPSVHGIDFINCEEIIYCMSESNYTRIYLSSGRKILATKTLKEIENLLPQALFFRIHNSYIANLSKAVRFLHEGSGVLVLEKDYRVKVSRTKKKELLERLELS